MERAGPLAFHGIDHLELYVGNARQAAHFYRTALGFGVVAYAGPETGVRDRASYVLAQGRVRLVLTAPLHPGTPIAEHVHRHGDGVRDIALTVDDAVAAYETATGRGARGVLAPTRLEDEHGWVVKATIATYGDTVHSFIERHGYPGPFLPGYRPRTIPGRGVGFTEVDHVVGNVELGSMNAWVDFYRRVLGFTQLVHFDDQDISTAYSALMSKVMQDGQGRIKFPINEPAQGRRKSQVQEYLEYYQGPGVQHIALLTDDIVRTVEALRANGVEFLSTPGSYYEALPERVGAVDEDLEVLRPVQDRPTVFFEVIQRKGSRGFGKGNFKALFEAIEREQALRGNL
jgi:4-hydroxyphenylpyruvate dioxygenase